MQVAGTNSLTRLAKCAFALGHNALSATALFHELLGKQSRAEPDQQPMRRDALCAAPTWRMVIGCLVGVHTRHGDEHLQLARSRCKKPRIMSA